MIRIESHLRWQVERDRQPGLPVFEQVAETPIRLAGGPHTRVLAHGPQTPSVHARVDPARERRRAGCADIRVEIVPREILGPVDVAELDPGRGLAPNLGHLLSLRGTTFARSLLGSPAPPPCGGLRLLASARSLLESP